MTEEKNMSASIGALSAALSKAQGEFEHAKKDVKNEFFKSKYADLASVIDAARVALSKNNLAVIQTTHTVDGKLLLVTTLSHSSGEWIRGEYPINPVKQDPQGFGSAMTYARRYAFSAITGIASDDDDGNAASNKTAIVTPTIKPVFSNASLRNTFTKNVIASFNEIDDHDEGAVDTLNTLYGLNKEKLTLMKESGDSHDELALDEIRKIYVLKKQSIEQTKMMNEQLKEVK